MKINKKIINKIEGEATLKIKEKSGVVEFVKIEFWQYRGVEEFLVNRHYMDALVINPRVCGICGHSHLLATAKAIENAFNIEVTQKAKILREITTGLEIIQNHIKWFYITLYPTLIKDKSFALKAMKYSSFISKIIALISGQYPHNSYIIPGGVTCDLTNFEVLKIKNMLMRIRDFEEEIFRDFENFFNYIDKDVGKGLNRFLVLGDNLYFKANGSIDLVKESKTNSLYKNVMYDGEFYEVGPLARNLEKVKDVYEVYEDSIYSRIFARLKEIFLVLEYLIERVNEIDINEKSYVKFKKDSGIGKSVVEAPRGPLIHKVEIEKNLIKSYEIIVPTQFNLSNGTLQNPSPAQKALIREKVEDIDTIFKCFDICAVCVSH